MSRHRHEMQKKHHDGHHDGHHKHHRASGGRTEMKVSGNPDVFEEAHEEHKKGGRVKKKHKHHEMHADGKKPHHRMDRPKRAKGGRVSGSDMNPFSSAKNPMKGPEPAVEDNKHYKVSSTKDTRDNSKRDEN